MGKKICKADTRRRITNAWACKHTDQMAYNKGYCIKCYRKNLQELRRQEKKWCRDKRGVILET